MVQDEIAAWAERLAVVGVDRTPEVLETELWALAEGIVARRRSLLRPFRPYYRRCGTTQSWQLFVIPQRYPARLHIDIQESGDAWRPLYIARDNEADWNRKLLDTERMRSMLFRYSWSHYQRRFRRFGRWMARKAAVDFPGAEALRLRWFRQKTPTPGQVRRGRVPEGTFEGEIEFSLVDLP